jgi:spore germination protein KB
MGKDILSQRQLLVLLFAAMLAPLAGGLPGQLAALAGEGAWAAPLLALPLVLLWCWMIKALFSGQGKGQNLMQLCQNILGKWLGGAVILLYLIWGLFLLMVNTRLYGERLLSAGYQKVPLILLLALPLALLLWMSLGKLSAFLRAVEIFYLLLSVALGAVLVFALVQIKVEYVFPLWWEDLPRVLSGVVPVLGIVSYGIFGTCFLDQLSPGRRGAHFAAMRWGGAFCLVLALLQLAAVGQFGGALCAGMEEPFLQLVAGIGVQGAFQRLEGVSAALWILADLALLGLLAFACKKMGKTLLPAAWREEWLPAAILLIALVGALNLFPDAFSAQKISRAVLPFGNLFAALFLPALLFIVGKLRKKL